MPVNKKVIQYTFTEGLAKQDKKKSGKAPDGATVKGGSITGAKLAGDLEGGGAGGGGIKRELDKEYSVDMSKVSNQANRLVSKSAYAVKARSYAAIDTCVNCIPTTDMVVTLPRITPDMVGKIVIVKNITDSSNDIVIGPNIGSESINGEQSHTIAYPRSGRILICASRNEWSTIDTNYHRDNEDYTPPPTYTNYYYALGNDTLMMKTGSGSWTEVTLPGSPENLLDIAGTASDNMWVCGTYDSGRTKGYLATNQSGTWTEVEQADLIIIDNPWEINKLIVEESQTFIHATRTAGTGTYVRTYHTISGSWAIGYDNSAATDYTDPKSFTKKGAYITVTGSSGNIMVGSPPYTYDLNGPGPEDDEIYWDVYAEGTNLPQDIDIHPNPSTSNNYRLRDDAAGTITLTSGSTNSWSSVGTYGNGSSPYVALSNDLLRCLWVSDSGTPYVLASTSAATPNPGLIYNWATTPTYISIGADSASNVTIHGIDDSEVCFLKGVSGNCMFQTWNGTSLSTAEDTGIGAARALWCIKEED